MVFLVVVLTIPLGIIMNGIIQNSREDQTIHRILQESDLLEEMTDLDINRSQNRDQLIISATVRSAEPLTQEIVNTLKQELENELDHPITLDIITLPFIRSD